MTVERGLGRLAAVIAAKRTAGGRLSDDSARYFDRTRVNAASGIGSPVRRGTRPWDLDIGRTPRPSMGVPSTSMSTA